MIRRDREETERQALKTLALQGIPSWHIFCSTPAHKARWRAIIVPMEQLVERSPLHFFSDPRYSEALLGNRECFGGSSL